MNDNEYLFKVMLIGNSGVGKSCLVRQFTQGYFPSGEIVTIGADFTCKAVEIGEDRVNLQIWDTAGQERFRSISQSYYRSAHAMVLVYDIARQPTFDNLTQWINDINIHSNPKVLKILVGNKTDLPNKEIPSKVGEEFARNHNMIFCETSAKDIDSVNELYKSIAVILYNNMKNQKPNKSNEVNLTSNNTFSKCKC